MRAVLQTGNMQVQLPAWWLYRMMQSKNQWLEKLVLFWHGHFATSAAKVNSVGMMLAQNDLIRQKAAGPFAELVSGISRDPAMLIYLDSATNRRNNPNENYARELLELFCLGLGNYTERDIRELARAFTGWEIRSGNFQFNQFQHDPAPKFLLGKNDIESGEEAIAWIVEQPAAARFIAHKLYRFYVSDQPADDSVIEGLAELLRAEQFVTRPVLKQMFSSQIFYSDAARGQKIRSPVELAIGLLRCLQATASPVGLAPALAGLGQAVFYPPNVKGWDGGKRWINSATLIGRINLVARGLDHPQTRFPVAREQLDAFWKVTDPADAVRLVETHWFARAISDNQRDDWTRAVEQSAPPNGRLLSAWKAAATIAEFQLG
jgi:uncharacterized protein (DUF1800 family)